MKPATTYALVTGASKGLGRAYARELASMGKNLILVSLPWEDLENITDELKAQSVEVIGYETDFCSKKNIIEFTDWVNDNYQLEILINNAGTGGSSAISEVSAEHLDYIIRLNVTAPTLLIHQLLPNLLRLKKSYILNVASMATFLPMAFKTVYPASKHFIRHFSACLQEELKHTGVSVSCVYPGPMRTNAQVNSRIDRYGMWGRLILMTPEEVAQKSLKKLFRKNKNIIPGWANKVYWFLMTKLPSSFVMPMVARAVKKELLDEKLQRK